MAYSAAFHEVINALSPPETPITLVRISHPLATTIRLVNDTKEVISNGEAYIPVSFKIVMPDDQESSPQASLAISNTTNELTRLFERTAGARGTKVKLIDILPSNPDLWENSVEMSVSSVTVSPEIVSLKLGYEDVLNKASIPVTYRPPSSAGKLGFKGLF